MATTVSEDRLKLDVWLHEAVGEAKRAYELAIEKADAELSLSMDEIHADYDQRVAQLGEE